MKIAIGASASNTIDEKYKEEAIKITSYLASCGYDLIWGSGINSLMGICYDESAKQNRRIYGYTTKKYIDYIKDLPKAEHFVCEDTFELKKELFNNSDIILCLAGGIGTISEFFSFLEEIRSNDISKLLILYDENNHYDKLIDLINDMVIRTFNKENTLDFFKVVYSLSELEKVLLEYRSLAD